MGYWHRPDREGKCIVCFAGAMLSFTGEMNPNYTLHRLENVDAELWRSYAEILNYVRMRNIVLAENVMIQLDLMGRPTGYSKEFPGYATDPEGFKAGVRRLIEHYQNLAL
jgi:hypothetical protein